MKQQIKSVFRFLVICFTISCIECQRITRPKRNNNVGCYLKTLVRYQLTLSTEWSRKAFPKMYPTYRPPAQWSSVVGRTHNSGYTMWREGDNVTYPVQKMVEEGDPTYLHRESAQGHYSVMDSFTTPPIESGVGQTSAVIMLDGSHTQVSFLAKIVPSPDWFIGVSNLDLCHKGRWRKQLSIDLNPLDAGTDQGLTFTSPNWKTDLQLPVTEITSQFPNHPASSFYYPEKKVLPRIAHVTFDLIAEYRLRGTYSDIINPVTTTTTTTTTTTITTKTSAKILDTSSWDKLLTRYPNPGSTQVSLFENRKLSTPRETNGFDKGVYSSQSSKVASQVVTRASLLPTASTNTNSQYTDRSTPRKISTEKNTQALSNSNKPSTARNTQASLSSNRHTSSPKTDPTTSTLLQTPQTTHFAKVSSTQLLEKEVAPTHCIVSEWTEWGPCSKTCGFGRKERTREVLNHPDQTSAPCPPVKENALCGSMRKCSWNHFSMLGPRKIPRPSRRIRGRHPGRRRALAG